jgi:transcriptional regulator with XRE-family HTH domain
MLNIALIKENMLRAGLSQPDLAKRCDVSREAVSNWLSGESVPRPKKLKAICEALAISIEALIAGEGSFPEPVIAYRTRNHAKVTGAAKEAALDLADHLQQLVPFVRKETLFAPAVLEKPVANYEYIREAAQQVRARVGVPFKAVLTRNHLVQLHRHFGSILVPVMWDGEKAGHENALSVYLPASRTSFVVFNLISRIDDFNYWLAHELAHCYSLHTLQDDEGEVFCEQFARELLFPRDLAQDVLDDIVTSGCPQERAASYAGQHGISIITVVKQIDAAAAALGRAESGIEGPEFYERWNASKATTPTVVEEIFGTKHPSADEYILKSEEHFKTLVFRALAHWQIQEGGRSPAFISNALNVSIGSALELSHALMRLHD